MEFKPLINNSKNNEIENNSKKEYSKNENKSPIYDDFRFR